MSKIRIKLVRSGIGRPQKQKLTLQALGLTRLNKQVEHEATPQIIGMVEKVKHLLDVEKI
jgi:large subunit ribosomal protein L30